MKPFFLILISSLFLFSACEKKLFDYRNKYIGEYAFELKTHTWQMGSPEKDTTIYYSGEINYGDKGKIKIDWHDKTQLEFEVSKKGILSVCNKSVGKADKKTMSLEFDSNVCGTGPNGAKTEYSLKGEKK